MARNKYPEVTVEKILDVAQQLFLEKGYDNTTIQDIVNELGGLTKGAIYHHFKSKEEIIKNIEGFDKEIYLDKVDKFLKEQGCVDDGNASSRVVDWIENNM